MARRKKDSGGDGGGGANWMDTYADMVTLLMAFFVLLFSFSTIDAEKWEALVGSLTGTGRNVVPFLDMESAVDSPIELEITTEGDYPSEGEPMPGDEGNVEQDLENFLKLVEELKNFIEENELDAILDANQETFTVTLTVGENVFFDSGDATIKEESSELLTSLAQLFSDNMHIINIVNVEGHTDTDPINNERYEDNWDLSSKRATNAVRFIVSSADVDNEKFKPSGMSEYHPIATNDTPEGKAKNRRVDFVIQSVVTSELDSNAEYSRF